MTAGEDLTTACWATFCQYCISIPDAADIKIGGLRRSVSQINLGKGEVWIFYFTLQSAQFYKVFTVIKLSLGTFVYTLCVI